MRAVYQFFVQSAAALTGSAGAWMISFFVYGQAFIASSLIALIGGGAVFLTAGQVMNYRHVKLNGLTRKEYKYIDSNLKEAKEKLTRLRKALYHIRSIQEAKQNLEIYRTAQRIYTNVKNEPKRFYKAEAFFYSHLDSMMELAEKYAYLSAQPAKSREIQDSLRDTRKTIFMLGESVKKDLNVMLDDDIDTLHFELDVAKQSISRAKKD